MSASKQFGNVSELLEAVWAALPHFIPMIEIMSYSFVSRGFLVLDSDRAAFRKIMAKVDIPET